MVDDARAAAIERRATEHGFKFKMYSTSVGRGTDEVHGIGMMVGIDPPGSICNMQAQGLSGDQIQTELMGLIARLADRIGGTIERTGNHFYVRKGRMSYAFTLTSEKPSGRKGPQQLSFLVTRK
jgi:hypothetical protein